MTRRSALFPALLIALAACTPVDTPPEAPAPQFTTQKAEDGSCWGTVVIPAVYEQVPGQVQVVQAQVDENGTIIQPPIYRNATVPKEVRPRREKRFPAPCPDQITPEFIASIQRALLARGYYRGGVTSRFDEPTLNAILRFQSERGLKSSQISLDSARELGLAAVDLN
ncbi:MAG: peptidoglycan-binding domain-containing protein [Pseudomonadota bacterium]|nr:peptidoglycan-binding domain-containing protein [Pseudomonadota bacterium]MEC8580756.1 peptidoglycan-binding domain-containing protein [Pseudomonadota bacterium]